MFEGSRVGEGGWILLLTRVLQWEDHCDEGMRWDVFPWQGE